MNIAYRYRWSDTQPTHTPLKIIYQGQLAKRVIQQSLQNPLATELLPMIVRQMTPSASVC